MIHIDFCALVRTSPEGEIRHWMVGRGADGSVWADYKFLGLNAQDLKLMFRTKRESIIELVGAGVVMVELSTHASLQPEERRKAVLELADTLADEMHPSSFR